MTRSSRGLGLVVVVAALVAVVAGRRAPAAAGDADVAAVERLVTAQAASFGIPFDELDENGPLLWISGKDRLGQLWAAQLGFIQSNGYKVVAMGSDDEPEVSAKVKGLSLGLADDRQSAWVAFTLDVTLAGPGKKPKTIKTSYRVTEFVARKGDGWIVLAAHWSQGIKNAEAVKRAKAGGLEADPLAEGDKSVGEADVVQAIEIAVAPGIGLTLADVTSKRADVFAFGSDPGESYAGAKLRKAAAKWKFKMEVKGPVLAGLAPGKKTAWGLVNVVASFGEGAKAYSIPYRVMFVLVHNPDGEGEMDWDVVQAHFSIQLPG